MKQVFTLIRLSNLHKWGNLYFLFVAFLLSSLINWSIHHIHFRDVSISSVSTIAVIVSILAAFVFFVRWLDINRLQVSPEAGYPLTSNGRQLGILLFGIGVFVGPAVTLYMIACYLAFAPLFVDNQGSVKFDSLFIAIAFGILISGLLYVLSADIGLPGELSAPIVLLGLAAFNLLKQKRRIMPTIAFSNYLAFAVLSILFISYGGAALVGSVMMGFGDYPPVFFNTDTPFRLTQAHEIFMLTEYPPESLTTKGIFRSYHYGGPAAAATIAAITGLALHKSMFFVALPILLIGSFSAICLLSRSVLQRSSYRYLSIMLFLPSVLLGEKLYYQFIFMFQQDGAGMMLKKLVNQFVPHNNYHPESFSGGIWDITMIAAVFLLMLSASLLVKQQLRQVLIIAPVLVLLTFFTKIALIPAVSVLVGIRLLTSWKAYRAGSIFWYVLGSSGVIILVLYLFGTFEAVGNSVTINPINKITQVFTRGWVIDPDFLELYAVTGGSALFFLLLYLIPPRHQDTNGVLLVTGALVLTCVCFMLVVVIDVWSLKSFITSTWIGIPLICTALMTMSGSSRYQKYIVNAIIAPILVIALMGQWHKIQHLEITMKNPEKGHEYLDNSELAEALATITKEESMVVTNNFEHFGFAQDQQYQITSLFGHQAYAADIFFMQSSRISPGQGATLKDLVSQRVHLQKTRLSSIFNRAHPEFSTEVALLAKQEGWTHFLFKKGDMGMNLRSPSILYEGNGSNTILRGDSAESSRNNPQSYDPFPIMLRRESNTKFDRVTCGQTGLSPDGHADNVFIAELDRDLGMYTSYVRSYEDLLTEYSATDGKQTIENWGKRHWDKHGEDEGRTLAPKITSIELLRENPSGLYQTDNYGRFLGVSSDPDSTFLNKKNGQVEISNYSGKTRFWLFSCASGRDSSDSRYFVRLTFSSPIKIPEYDSTDDIPLIKIFENDTYAVYQF